MTGMQLDIADLKRNDSQNHSATLSQKLLSGLIPLSLFINIAFLLAMTNQFDIVYIIKSQVLPSASCIPL